MGEQRERPESSAAFQVKSLAAAVGDCTHGSRRHPGYICLTYPCEGLTRGKERRKERGEEGNGLGIDESGQPVGVSAKAVVAAGFSHVVATLSPGRDRLYN
jgi:hypothetical protein